MTSSNISVITFYTPNYSIGDKASKVNSDYCKRHGYSFTIYNQVPYYMKNRHPAWCKLHYLLKNMEDTDSTHVMWIDADAFFCNHAITIQEWIDKYDDKQFIIGRDAGYTLAEFEKNEEPKVNSGVIILKNTLKNKNILNHLINDKIYIDNYNPRRSKNNKTKITGWDQAAIRHVIMKDVMNINESLAIITDTNFNNNCKQLKEYIDNGGFIVHLTSFNGKFSGQKKDNMIVEFSKTL